MDALTFDKLICAAQDRREMESRGPETSPGPEPNRPMSVAAEVHALAYEWHEKGFPHKMVEMVHRRTALDPDKPEQLADETDHRVLTFVCTCAFYFGRNWRYLFERIKDNPGNTNVLFGNLESLTHVRPRLRMLFAFQLLPVERIRSYGEVCRNPELSGILCN